MSAAEANPVAAPLRPDLRGNTAAIGRSSTATRTVYVAAIGFGIVFAAAASLYYLSYQEARLDLGDMIQAIWSTSHGHLLRFMTPSGQELSRLGAHADPFLVLLVPLWWIWPSPLGLLIVQALSVAAGALPVYWLGKKHLASERAGAHLAIAYLILPATQFNAFTPASGLHAVSFAVPLLLYAIWFLDENRLVPFAVCACLAVTTKEEIGAAVAMLGLWYAVRTRRRRTGATIFLAGLGVSCFAFLVVIPHYSLATFRPFESRYAAVGSTPTGILRKAVTDPGALVHATVSGHKAVYLLMLLVPLLGLCLLEPLLLLGAVPDLLINLLSSDANQSTIQFQYAAGIVPFFVAATVFGMKRATKNPDRLSLVLAIVVGCSAIYSPIIQWQGAIASPFRNDPVRQAKTRALSLIPSGATVAASNQLAGYLSARRFIYVFPSRRRAEWILTDKRDPTYSEPQAYARALRALEADTRWRRVFDAQGVEVFRARQG